ncbi:hypothetical protein KN815_12425 [Streptomyces sp. 4503]|uniref:Uncharacterized protein n=1 Tax=Streptomyces niphimycinicus TaxID=2842201 RepID=A0ABS6CD56_9ACTN|nr:hypothetical protein [Streptomyces niphimycinicus]MBU3864851.1 hypothetical protein [Streptomyces niphimycinicus]
MSISSEHPASADQIYRALVAVGAEPLFDPEIRPEGPQEEDRLRLLGVLLAKAELELTASTRLADEQMEDVAETVIGWAEHVGPDSDRAAACGRLSAGRRHPSSGCCKASTTSASHDAEEEED